MTALTTSESFGDFLASENGQSRWKSFPWIMVGTALFVLGSIGSAFSYTAREDAQIRREYALELEIYREQADRIARLQQITHDESEVAAQAGFDASLVDAFPRSRSLAEITSALNAGIRLTDISLANTDLSAGSTAIWANGSGTEIEPPANQLQIKGVAQSSGQLSAFVARLSRSGWFHTIKLSPNATENDRAIGPVRFIISAIYERNSSNQQSGTRPR